MVALSFTDRRTSVPRTGVVNDTVANPAGQVFPLVQLRPPTRSGPWVANRKRMVAAVLVGSSVLGATSVPAQPGGSGRSGTSRMTRRSAARCRARSHPPA